VTSLVTGNLAPTEAHEEVRLRVEPVVPHGSIAAHEPTLPHGQTGFGSLVAPQGGDPADTDEGGTSLPSCGPATRRTVPAGPDVSLGPLGWLAVLLVAVLLTVLAHAASVHSDQLEHREPSLLTDPAFVLAQSAE
jgi:hypothetical protein